MHFLSYVVLTLRDASVPNFIKIVWAVFDKNKIKINTDYLGVFWPKQGVDFQIFSKTHLVHLYWLILYVCCKFGGDRSSSIFYSAV